MKVIAFAASNSLTSINKTLATYAANQISDASVEVLDLNHYEMPIYSPEREENSGIPEQAHQFRQQIGDADLVIVSFAEHNGSYSAAFKNIFDWTSRIDMKVWQGKPMLMLATSPGPGGAQNVLKAAVTSAPYFDGQVKASMSVPSFYDNFDQENNTLSDDDLRNELAKAVISLTDSLTVKS